jgi:hypothetical protein
MFFVDWNASYDLLGLIFVINFRLQSRRLPLLQPRTDLFLQRSQLKALNLIARILIPMMAR